MRMNNLYRCHTEDVLEKKGITWHGWHAIVFFFFFFFFFFFLKNTLS